MAGVQDHRLAAAVSAAGALGSLPAATLDPRGLEEQIRAFRAVSTGPLNVNFFCHAAPQPDAAREAAWRATLASYRQEFGVTAAPPAGPGRQPFSLDALAVLEAFGPQVVSFHFGLPDPNLLARVRATGSLIMSSATTVDEALWLEARGVDAIIAQGLEAGGHRGMFLSDDVTTQVGTFALLPQVVRAVKVPVIAAGGIADARTVRAARALGASAVQLGTAFLCADEATTSALQRAVLQSPAARHTALTNVFTGRPARGIVNRAVRELGPMRDQVPAFPLATAAMAPLRAAAEAQQRDDFTPLWCGQNTGGMRCVPAAEIVRDIADAWRSAGVRLAERPG